MIPTRAKESGPAVAQFRRISPRDSMRSERDGPLLSGNSRHKPQTAYFEVTLSWPIGEDVIVSRRDRSSLTDRVPLSTTDQRVLLIAFVVIGIITAVVAVVFLIAM